MFKSCFCDDVEIRFLALGNIPIILRADVNLRVDALDRSNRSKILLCLLPVFNDLKVFMKDLNVVDSWRVRNPNENTFFSIWHK